MSNYICDTMRQVAAIKSFEVDTISEGGIFISDLDTMWSFIVKHRGQFEITQGANYVKIDKKHEYFKSKQTGVFLSNIYKRKTLFYGRCYESLRKFLDVVFYPYLYQSEIEKLKGKRDIVVRVELEYLNKEGKAQLYLTHNLSLWLPLEGEL